MINGIKQYPTVKTRQEYHPVAVYDTKEQVEQWFFFINTRVL